MQTVSADPRVPEPTQENLGISGGLGRSPLNNGLLEKFAQNMTENIIQSFLSQMEMVEAEVDFRVSRCNQSHEMLAEGLASAVVEAALREVCRGHPEVKDLPLNNNDFEDMDTEMDPGRRIQTSRVTQPYHPPLSQTGLPLVGSLDYPDAPPTTPLLPELERSRHSFARKLKGGLARVFLPSPPPPTPKDKDNDSDSSANDPQVELMEHLMHSLPEDDLARDRFEAGPHHVTTMEAFAEALSCDIIDCVLSTKEGEQKADNDSVHLLAHQLAETIITSSLDEISMLV